MLHTLPTALPLHSLPPILHINYPNSMQSYSEGARGLSVPLRVIGIFTDTTISPSSWLRQCPDRYTGDEGQNRGSSDKPAGTFDRAETVGAKIPGVVDRSNRQGVVQLDRN